MNEPNASPVARWWVPAALLCALVGAFFWIRSARAPEPGSPDEAAAPVNAAALDEQRWFAQAVAAARAEEAKGDLPAALDRYQQILARRPDDKEIARKAGELITERTVRTTMGDGDRSAGAGDWDAARRSYEAAFALTSSEEIRGKLKNARFMIAIQDAGQAEAKGDLAAALAGYRAALDFMENEEARAKAAALDARIQEQERTVRHDRFAEKFNAGEAAEKEARYPEAVASYGEARPFTDDPTLLDTRIESCRKKQLEIEQLFAGAMAAARKAVEAEDWSGAIVAVDKAISYRKDEPEALALKKSATEQAILREMVLIPAGDFVMGGSDSPEEGPVRTLFLGAYYMDRHEVTNGQYQVYVEATRSAPPVHWKGTRPPKGHENLPVIGITAVEAEAYARWAGKRLPTEEEWEKAARGPDGRKYPWGNEYEPPRCVGLTAERDFAAAVGSCPAGASPYGCMDMAGNVIEWTSTVATRTSKDSQGQDAVSEWRVLKGGSFLYPGERLRACNRFFDDPQLNFVDVGFRCARDAVAH